MKQVKASAGRESVFNRIADYVSAAMGRPVNIMIWLVLVVGWTLLFAAHIVSANVNFLPAWFTGTALELTLVAIADQEKHIEDVETKLSAELASNTVLTQQVHDLASRINDFLTQSGSQVAGKRTRDGLGP
jgi:low affinity Fe/Cu permease